MEMIQIEVKRRQLLTDALIEVSKVVWVDARWKLKEGLIVKFDGDDGEWKVTKVYEQRKTGTWCVYSD
jgi:hypothetical protein